MAWDKCFRILVGGEGEGLGMGIPLGMDPVSALES